MLGRTGQKGAKESATGTPVPETPTLQEAAAAAQQFPAGPKMDGTGANGVLPTHTFDLDVQDQRGRRWTGRFKCHVLTVRERTKVGLVRSRLANGLPPHSLDVFTSDLLEILAHLAVALDEAPDWAKEGGLENMYATEIVQAIYEEVAAHERRFHGAGSGRSGSGDDPGPSVEDGVGVAPQDG